MSLTITYKHEKLTEILREELKSKKFPENRFYTVKHLMDHYGVSQATLSRALLPLFQEGLLYSVAGKGTFIAEQNKAPEAAEKELKNLFCVISDTEVFSKEFNPTDWFVMREIIQGIVSCGKKLGYHVNLCPLTEDINMFKKLSSLVDSMFIFTEYHQSEQLIEHCIKESIPYAVYGRHNEISRNLNQVWVDIRDGIFKATKHLIELGHSNIAFLGDFDNSLRHQGYKQALKAADIRRRKKYSYFNYDGKVESSEEAGARILKEHPEVTAIVCSSDLRAVGVINSALAAGRSIPELAITGFDNINDFYPVPIKLTTMEFPRKAVGKELVKIAEAYKKDGKIRKEKIETQIVNGMTT